MAARNVEIAICAVVGAAAFFATIALWGDWPPSVGQHLLPISGLFWMAALARYLAPNRRVVLACVVAYLSIVAPAAYIGAFAHGTHVIYASICYFAITAIGTLLLVHAYRVSTPLVRAVFAWRLVAIVLVILTVDTLRYAIVLLARWLGGIRA